jgi:hypothetical protein
VSLRPDRSPGYTRRVPDSAALPDPEHSPEDVRPLPVLAEPRVIEPAREVSLPAAVVAATGGFVLGVAAFVLVHVLRRPRTSVPVRLRRGRGRSRRSEIAASRSFLVDVHLLKDR